VQQAQKKLNEREELAFKPRIQPLLTKNAFFPRTHWTGLEQAGIVPSCSACRGGTDGLEKGWEKALTSLGEIG
jgi:hypothetical protein